MTNSAYQQQIQLQRPDPRAVNTGHGSTTDKEGGSISEAHTDRELKRSNNNYNGLNQPRYIDSSHADDEDRIYRDLTEESSPEVSQT
jgi:hypothetical protein